MKKRIKYTQTAELNGFPGCCGLDVLCEFNEGSGELDAWGNDELTIKNSVQERDSAIVATTIPSQKQAIRELKALGFTAVASFMGNHRNRITLWFINKKRARKVKGA